MSHRLSGPQHPQLYNEEDGQMVSDRVPSDSSTLRPVLSKVLSSSQFVCLHRQGDGDPSAWHKEGGGPIIAFYRLSEPPTHALYH